MFLLCHLVNFLVQLGGIRHSQLLISHSGRILVIFPSSCQNSRVGCMKIQKPSLKERPEINSFWSKSSISYSIDELIHAICLT